VRLSLIEKRWLNATFDGFAPPAQVGPEGHLVPRPDEADHVANFQRLNARATPLAKLGLHVALAMAGTAPLWGAGKLQTIEAMPLEDRVALLERMSEHTNPVIRDLTWLLKVQASMSLMGTKSLRSRSRYDAGKSEGTPVRLRRKGDVREVA